MMPSPDSPNNHLWGINRLSEHYDVTCAKVPENLIKKHFKGAALINSLWKSFVLFFKYANYPIVYSACGELTTGFALANKLHLGKRRLFKIHHHGNSRILFPRAYTKILFISQYVFSLYQNVMNKCFVDWGGDRCFASKCLNEDGIVAYDFISAGKSGRDHECMIKAANSFKGKTMIIAAVSEVDYDKSRITILSGDNPKKNSTGYLDVYRYYQQSRFIVIPIQVRPDKFKDSLSGLTTFVDAVVLGKPVLVSDNSNMGIDIEGLGIGLVYKAGDVNDMLMKMNSLDSLSENEYQDMCLRMKRYSESHNYETFCSELIRIIKES